MWDKLTLIIGPSQTGKTTLGNYLAQAPNTIFIDEPNAPRAFHETYHSMPLLSMKYINHGLDWPEDLFEYYRRHLLEQTEKRVGALVAETENLIVTISTALGIDKFIRIFEPGQIICTTRKNVALQWADATYNRILTDAEEAHPWAFFSDYVNYHDVIDKVYQDQITLASVVYDNVAFVDFETIKKLVRFQEVDGKSSSESTSPEVWTELHNEANPDSLRAQQRQRKPVD